MSSVIAFGGRIPKAAAAMAGDYVEGPSGG